VHLLATAIATMVVAGSARADMLTVPSVDYPTIQSAIAAAVDGDEVVVDPGTYFETIDLLGKAIWLHSSDGPAVTTIDGDGAYHVVQCVSGEGPGTILEGFTITGGNANGMVPPDYRGGGMYNEGSSPTVTNCTFSGNTAAGDSWGEGGGMFNNASSPTVTGCIFSANSADTGGGGMFNYNYSSPTVTGCIFSANSADTGGGMFNDWYSSPTVTNCTFSGHSVAWAGGMGNIANSSPTVTNCMFSGNVALEGGGGMYNAASSPNVINCTFTGNSTANGGALFNVSSSHPVVTNSILWANGGAEEIWNNPGSSPVVTYSDVQLGYPGTGNLDADPLFVDPPNGDYRLHRDSPCVDAGHNWGVPADTQDLDDDGDTIECTPLDLDGQPRFAAVVMETGGCGARAIVDIGAYETDGIPAHPVMLGDTNGDSEVDIHDLLNLLAAWGPVSGCELADTNLDGVVDTQDLLILLAHWG
jgi:hypothetical protein